MKKYSLLTLFGRMFMLLLNSSVDFYFLLNPQKLKTLRQTIFIGLLSFCGVSGWAQTAIYTQNFGAGTSFPTGWTATGSSTWTISTSNTSTGYTNASGGSNASSGSSNQPRTITLANSVSTVGYTNISIIWAARRSHSNVVTCEWSINGTTWNSLTFTDVANNSTWALVNGGTGILLPSGAENVTNLRLRWTYDSDNTAGRYRIDDVLIKGISNTPFWYKADGAVTFDGNTWDDETSNNIDAVRSSGTFSLVTNSVNFNPSVQFTNVDRQMMTPVSASVKSFILVNLPTSTTDLAGLIGNGSDKGIRLSNGIGDGIEDASWRGDNNTDDWYSGGSSRINGNNDSFQHNFKWHIVNQTASTAVNAQYYLGGYFSGRSFSGNIAEIMAFSGDVPNQNNIESYLAIKYGITLPGNYYTSGNATTWALTSGYQNDVHGIGRDDAYGLDQRSSKSENPGTDILTIQSGAAFVTPVNAQSGSALTNQQFFITGHNNGSTTTVSTLSTGINTIARKWYAQVTNPLSTESLQFSLPTSTITDFGTYCKIGILIADNDALTTNQRFVEGTLNATILTVNDAAITGDKYFSVAVLKTPTTGSIGNDQTVCAGEVPATINSISDGTGFGTVSYRWESSTDGINWTIIDGATSNLYAPGALLQTTQFRRKTVSSLGATTCSSDTTSPIVITITTSPVISLSANQAEVCFGDVLTTLGYTVSTGSPNVYSIDFDSTAEGAGFTDISDATLSGGSIDITVPATAVADSYNAVLTAKDDSTGCISSEKPITVVVHPLPDTSEIQTN